MSADTSLDSTPGSSLYLWFVCLVAACGGLLFGYDAVVVSGTNSLVESQFSFSKAQLGFYVSCVLWGCAVGSGIAGPLADALGRKKTLMGAAIMIFASAAWSGLAASPENLTWPFLFAGNNGIFHRWLASNHVRRFG